MSVQEKGCMYRRSIVCIRDSISICIRIVCIDEGVYVHDKDCMYRKRIVCNGVGLYVEEEECLYRRRVIYWLGS